MFISNAYAQAAPAAAGSAGVMGTLGTFMPLILMFVVMYFLMIRPQQKRAREHRDMMNALAKGDEVVTAGGLLGRVTKTGEQYVTLDVGTTSTNEIVVQKSAVTTLLPKGTIKGL